SLAATPAHRRYGSSRRHEAGSGLMNPRRKPGNIRVYVPAVDLHLSISGGGVSRIAGRLLDCNDVPCLEPEHLATLASINALTVNHLSSSREFDLRRSGTGNCAWQVRFRSYVFSGVQIEIVYLDLVPTGSLDDGSMVAFDDG